MPQVPEATSSLPYLGLFGPLVQRRLGGLSPIARNLVQIAAVSGQETPTQLLGSVGDVQPEALAEPLHELRRRQVLVPASANSVRFAHHKVREIAYTSIDPSQWQVLHARVAMSYESTAASEAVPPGNLARLWEEGGDTEKAIPLYAVAARAAKKQFAHLEAERLFRAYLCVAKVLSPERIKLRNELAYDVMRLQGRIEDARNELTISLLEAQQIGALSSKAECSRLIGTVLWQTGRMDEARSSYEAALAIRRELGDRSGQGIVLGNLAMVQQNLGRYHEARALYEQALAIKREVGDRAGEGITLGNLAIISF